MVSSTVTTLTVLLIIVFLFTEAGGLFNQSPLEGESVIVVNEINPVKHLTAAEIKDIYDQKITNWKVLGGQNDSIILFSLNYIEEYFTEEEVGSNFEFLPHKIDSLVGANTGIVAVISKDYLQKNHRGKLVSIDNIHLGQFLKGKEWFPTAQPAVQMGVLPIILGTLWVSIIAILIFMPVVEYSTTPM